MATDDFETLSRRELQALAKRAGIKANQKNVTIIAQLRAAAVAADAEAPKAPQEEAENVAPNPVEGPVRRSRRKGLSARSGLGDAKPKAAAAKKKGTTKRKRATRARAASPVASPSPVASRSPVVSPEPEVEVEPEPASEPMETTEPTETEPSEQEPPAKKRRVQITGMTPNRAARVSSLFGGINEAYQRQMALQRRWLEARQAREAWEEAAAAEPPTPLQAPACAPAPAPVAADEQPREAKKGWKPPAGGVRLVGMS